MVDDTLGPWHYGAWEGLESYVHDEECFIIANPHEEDGDAISVVEQPDGTKILHGCRYPKEHAANGHLIAAAPDLLAALELCRDHVRHLPNISERVDTAIAKAGGNSRVGRAYTVVGLYPDSEWGQGMREAVFVEHVEADCDEDAIGFALEKMAAQSGFDVEELEVLALFKGCLMDFSHSALRRVTS